MSDQNAQQQIVDELKEVDNILVTVSRNPSVDALSAALGFTLMINKLNKHGTAVFSGDIPPAITFLDPAKTFENTVDSLRDFIIALDKEKADHLRYKVDGDMVKIFITPYRTTITDSDLDFSQGDYNVEMVIAIGVENNDDLDKALADHGRILHDATVASIGIGDTQTQLGSLHWHERDASSYSELLASFADKLRGDKTLLDEQIATAFLTGIVAATDRFSNQRTSSRAMTIAAQLMAAGANQQLIAMKLQEAEAQEQEAHTQRDGTTEMSDGKTSKIDRKGGKSSKKSKNTNQKRKPEEPVKDKPAADGTMTISHEKRGDIDEVTKQTNSENQDKAAEHAAARLREQQELKSSNENDRQEPEQPSKPQPVEVDLPQPVEKNTSAAVDSDEELAKNLASSTGAGGATTPSVADLQKDLQDAQAEIDQAADDPQPVAPAVPDMSLPQVNPTATQPQQGNSTEPTLGGTLNATSEQAAEDKRRQQNDDRNKTILTHASAPLSGDTSSSPVNSFNQPGSSTSPQGEPASVNPFGGDTTPTARAADVQPSSEPQAVPAPAQQTPTLADLDAQNRAHDEVRNAINEALNNNEQQAAAPAQPGDPAPANNGLPPLPPLPPMPTDFSQLPPLPNAPAPQPNANDDQLGALLPNAAPQTQAPQQQSPADPGQFKIPGSS